MEIALLKKINLCGICRQNVLNNKYLLYLQHAYNPYKLYKVRVDGHLENLECYHESTPKVVYKIIIGYEAQNY